MRTFVKVAYRVVLNMVVPVTLSNSKSEQVIEPDVLPELISVINVSTWEFVSEMLAKV